MGVMNEKKMPVNITFAGKAYEDMKLLEYAYAFEQATKRRVPPPLTPELPTDLIRRAFHWSHDNKPIIKSITAVVKSPLTANDELSWSLRGNLHELSSEFTVQVYVDGEEMYSECVDKVEWAVSLQHQVKRPEVLGWDLKPLAKREIMVIVVVKRQVSLEETKREARALWVPIEKAGEVSV
jgi:hypothetical protein